MLKNGIFRGRLGLPENPMTKKVPHCSTNFPADTLEVILSELLASTDVTLVLGRLRIKINANGPKFLRNE